jgi:hypothetical protein
MTHLCKFVCVGAWIPGAIFVGLAAKGFCSGFIKHWRARTAMEKKNA